MSTGPAHKIPDSPLCMLPPVVDHYRDTLQLIAFTADDYRTINMEIPSPPQSLVL